VDFAASRSRYCFPRRYIPIQFEHTLTRTINVCGEMELSIARKAPGAFYDMGIRPCYRTIHGVYPAGNGGLRDPLLPLVIERLAQEAVAHPFPMQFELIRTENDALGHLHFSPPDTTQGLGLHPEANCTEQQDKQGRNLSFFAVHAVHG
jgi:hypothetical protein